MTSRRYVELDLTVRVEVEDEAALRVAAAAAGLIDTSEPASCVGFLARAQRAVAGIPGTGVAGSAVSATYYDPKVRKGADEHVVRLTRPDLMALGAGLSAYLREFARHRAEDGGASHPEAEWLALQREVGQLLWRLEEAGKPPGASIQHSDDAVPPDPE